MEFNLENYPFYLLILLFLMLLQLFFCVHLLKHQKVLFATLLAEGKLWQYLADINTQAQQMFDTLVEKIKASEGVTEQLKEQDHWEWVQRIGNIEARAREIVREELICI